MSPEVQTRCEPPDRPAITRAQLAQAAGELGVQDGEVVMVHTSMKSLGWVVGGSDVVVAALLDAVGPSGTIVAMCGSQGDTWYGFDRWSTELQELYRAEFPAFDPKQSEAAPEVGRIPERIRSWPGAVRSDHPESSLVAVGAKAAWLMDPHPLDFPSGLGSPLERLVEADGKVLMLGAPLETLTLLHHAETMATAPDKRIVHYPVPVLQDGERTWVTVTDIDSTDGAYEYPTVCDEGVDAFDVIARAALETGVGVSGPVGDSTSHLFPSQELVRFAIDWIDTRFGA